ncbi:MAG: DUF5797 family protein [Halobacteriaceae archaeon]
MCLSEEARSRLADIVELQPTKNAELQDRWGLESGSEVHQYLESELKEYYYRDDDSLIRATPTAVDVLGGEPGAVDVTEFEISVLDVLAGPDAEPMSVVATLHALDEAGIDADVDVVRSTLRGLADRGLVELRYETVPTFRLAAPRDDLRIAEPTGEEDQTGDPSIQH